VHYPVPASGCTTALWLVWCNNSLHASHPSWEMLQVVELTASLAPAASRPAPSVETTDATTAFTQLHLSSTLRRPPPKHSVSPLHLYSFFFNTGKFKLMYVKWRTKETWVPPRSVTSSELPDARGEIVLQNQSYCTSWTTFPRAWVNINV